MPIYLGTTNLGNINLGSGAVEKIYLGDTLVFDSSSGPPPINVGLIHHYSATLFNNANDAVGGNDGTLSGGASIVADTDGGIGGTDAFNFGGSPQYMPLSAAIEEPAISVSLWIKPTLTTVQRVFSSRSSNTTGQRGIQVYNFSGTTRAEAEVDGGTSSAFVRKPAPGGNLNEWHHAVLTADGSNVTIYVDGALGETKAATGSISYGPSAQTAFARRADFAGDFFVGRLDTMRIYDRVLSLAEVGQLHSAGRNESGL